MDELLCDSNEIIFHRALYSDRQRTFTSMRSRPRRGYVGSALNAGGNQHRCILARSMSPSTCAQGAVNRVFQQWPTEHEKEGSMLSKAHNRFSIGDELSLAPGELEHAVSKVTSSLPPRHRIGILMSPAGRFLECGDCQISFKFPDGAQFGAIAKQFEFHLCGSQIGIPSWQTERRFVIVRYEGKVPAMASCAKCQLKFFTATFARDPVGAEVYLLDKFDLHECRKSQGNEQ